MSALDPVGESVIHHCVTEWIISTFDNLRREEMNSLLHSLTGDAVLSEVLRKNWQLDHLVLTDVSSVSLLQKRSKAEGGEQRAMAAARIVPDPFAAQCVRAVVGATMMENNYECAKSFCTQHVFPFLW